MACRRKRFDCHVENTMNTATVKRFHLVACWAEGDQRVATSVSKEEIETLKKKYRTEGFDGHPYGGWKIEEEVITGLLMQLHN